MEENNINIEIFLGLGILSFYFSFFIYRKLKSKNTVNKNIKKPELQKSVYQFHQIRDNFTMTTSMPTARRSNPLMRLITNFTGSCVTGNREDDNCLQTHILVHATKTKTQVTTAEAGSQVCEEILSKRERRSRLQSETEEGDRTPREGFIQEMFETSSNCRATQANSSIPETHTCSVCLDEICLGNTNTTTTACGHTFHLTCLLKSLTQKNLCPICRGELEDVRTKQMPSNVLTPVSAEQIIAEEISYFAVGSHTHSIMLSQHPKRRAKEMLRVFGFTLLRTVAEFVHDENMPAGWFDDSNTDSESEDDEEDGSGSDTQQENDDENNENDENNDDDDEEEGYSDNDANQAPENNQPIRGDLRDDIGW